MDRRPCSHASEPQPRPHLANRFQTTRSPNQKVSSSRCHPSTVSLLLATCLLFLYALPNALAQCDVSAGSWVYDSYLPPRYTGKACSGFLCYNRTDQKFLKYKWVAPGCNIIRFDPMNFVNMMRGKVIAFVGDSLSGNLANAITCSLSSVVPLRVLPTVPGFTPRKVTQWHIDRYNITIMRILSGYFVGTGTTGRTGYLDFATADPTWATFLHQTNYIVFGGMHWYLHGKFDYRLGAIPLQHLSDQEAITAVARSVKGLVTASGYTGVPIFTTYSPTHELGLFPPSDGRVNCAAFARPALPKQEPHMRQMSIASGIRDAQLQVFQGSRFKILDITRLSLLRPDGHSGSASGSLYKASADCSHWCVPGVPDTWTDLLYSLLIRSI